MGGVTQIVVGSVMPGGVAAPRVSGGLVAGTIEHSSLMMNTWRAGQVVGGSPRRLLIAQLMGVALGMIAAAGAYWLVVGFYGLGTKALPCVAPLSWKTTAVMVSNGLGGMPPGAPAAAGIAGLLGIVLAAMEQNPRLARFAPSAVGLGIGCIMPLTNTIGIGIGAVLGALATRLAPEWCEANLMPLASGLFAGEALAGVAVAAQTVAGFLT
jgi:uncharacterized oligopeptide transporter (OPT) family protein